MMNAKDEFQVCLGNVQKALEESARQGTTGDSARVKCLHAYKDELKKNVGRVQAMYEGYLQNYAPKDGSLMS